MLSKFINLLLKWSIFAYDKYSNHLDLDMIMFNYYVFETKYKAVELTLKELEIIDPDLKRIVEYRYLNRKSFKQISLNTNSSETTCKNKIKEFQDKLKTNIIKEQELEIEKLKKEIENLK